MSTRSGRRGEQHEPPSGRQATRPPSSPAVQQLLALCGHPGDWLPSGEGFAAVLNTGPCPHGAVTVGECERCAVEALSRLTMTSLLREAGYAEAEIAEVVRRMLAGSAAQLAQLAQGRPR